ncbi:MAG: GTP 3',8-cyclase MoaA [Candidatus Dadabacteria bacterium]
MNHLVDKFGRTVTKLRVSVTDRCNMRCLYCMPTEGLKWTSREEVLTFEEITRVVRLSSELGVRKIRITGGEPLLREGVEELIHILSQVPGIQFVSMTTNGYFLRERAEALAQAGLRGINISLDSLRPEKFKKIIRRNYFDRVIEGIYAAERAGLYPIKINVVVIRGYNDDEIEDFARLSLTKLYKIRFIEFMPLDGGGMWEKDLVVTKAEILERVNRVSEIVEVIKGDGGPARNYRFKNGNGEIGVIASVSQPFCGSCNRIRLTADGKIMTCLFALDEHDVKRLLRSNGTDDEIKDFLIKAVGTKWAGHLINRPGFIKPKRPMSAIGG